MNASLRRHLVAVLCGGVLACWTGLSAGQNAAPEKPPVPAAKAEPAPAKPQPAEASKAEPVIREQTIYIPYDKLRQVFEKQGRGVFLPYEKFQELWQAAQDKTRPEAEPKPPVAAIITESENEATVAKDVVEVKAVLKIELLGPGWHSIPLSLADAAITSATLGGKPARITGAADQGYRLLVEKTDKKAEQLELRLEYARAITRTPGQNSVSFQVPQAPVSRWKVRIPQAGVKVNLYPMIAATEVPAGVKPGAGAGVPPAKGEPAAAPAAKPAAKDEPAKEKSPAASAAPAAGPDETVVLAFVGFSPTVRIEWTPKAEGATGLKALASVQAQQQVWLNEGVTRTRTQLQYAISRAELAQLTIEVPADHKVVNVFDANVRQWSVKLAADAGTQQITAQLFEPAKGTQQVMVELEKFIGDEKRVTGSEPGAKDSGKKPSGEASAPTGSQTLRVPVVRAVDVGRQQGVVVVQVGEGLRAEAVKTTGLLQVDAGELPSPLAQTRWTFSYRYAAVPFELELGIEKIQPQIVATTLAETYLTPERLAVDLVALYAIERAGVFRLELDMPEGFEVRQVRGRAVAGAAAVEVDNHHLEGPKKTRLVVNLARKATGRAALVVELSKDLHEADLLTPTGKTVRIPLPLAQIAPGTVERATGHVVVYAPESLRVNPGKAEGVRSMSFKEALEGIPSAGEHRPAECRLVLAFAHTQEPVALELAVERRKPEVTMRQLLAARIEEGVIKYQATFFYDVLYSGVKSLRIDVPADVAAVLRNTTPGVREKVIAPAPEGLAKDYVAWSLAGESELMGSGKIELTWEKKLEKLDVGKAVTLDIPRLMPRQLDRAWGQIVVAKAETIDVQESGQPKGLRPIDPQQDLMAKVAGAARAFEFHDEWALALTATRYQLEEVKRTSIERAVVRMVITRAGQVPVQALYRMRSARQRLSVSLPQDVQFDTEPLRINGRPVALERDTQGGFVVPLVSPNADEPFLLELRYAVPGDGRELELPVFPEEPAVQKVHLLAYAPEEWVLASFDGPWSQDFFWRLGDWLQWRPASTVNDTHLVAWVREGVNVQGNPAETFPTAGQLYAFSTLRPAAPPDGSLKLFLRDGRWLHAIVLGLVVLWGLGLVTARLANRALAVGVLLVALVLLGAFAPTLAFQILDGMLAAALVVVLIVWAVFYVVWTRPAMLIARWTTALAEVPPAGSQTVAEPLGGVQGGIDLTKQPVEHAADEQKPEEEGEKGEGGHE